MKKLFALTLSIVVLFSAGNVFAATSAKWLTPADGSTYTVGTNVTVTGSAGADGGVGLDLALVLDSSGSMGWNGSSGWTAQRNAANALVDSLTPAGTAVAVIEFDSNASTVRTLTELTTDIAAVHTAINSVNASGGTAINSGVAQGAAELTGANHTAGRQQVMVVMSDGGSSASAAEAAAVIAMAAGVDAIHSVAMGSGANQATLRGMVDGPDDFYGNTDDYGVFSAASMAELTNLLTSGRLVGLDSVDVTDGNGNAIAFTLGGLGGVTLDWTIGLGENIFNMHAVGTDGTFADAQWTLYGQDPNPVVPEPSTIILLGSGLAGLAWIRRRKNNR